MVALVGLLPRATCRRPSRRRIVRQDFVDIAPMVAVPGVATDQESGRRASRVQVYGVDDRFWRFHGVGGHPAARVARGAAQSGAGTRPRRVGRRHDPGPGSAAVGHPARIAARAEGRSRPDAAVDRPRGARAADLGEFSFSRSRARCAPRSSRSHASSRISRSAIVSNVLLVSATDARMRRSRTAREVSGSKPPSDAGLRWKISALKVRVLDAQQQVVARERAALIDDAHADSAIATGEQLGMKPSPVMTYLANTIRRGDRQIPYSLVTAVELTEIVPGLQSEETSLPPDRAQRMGGAGARGEARRPRHARIRGLGGARPPQPSNSAISTWRRSCRSPGSPPIETSRRPIRASPNRKTSATGIRRSRSI